MWSAADILRGSLDPSDYRQPIMTLLFVKRLNDTFEENAERLIKGGKSEKEAYENKNRHSFFIPKIVGWKTKTSCEKKLCIAIYDILNENKYPEDKVGTLTPKIVELAKRNLP